MNIPDFPHRRKVAAGAVVIVVGIGAWFASSMFFGGGGDGGGGNKEAPKTFVRVVEVKVQPEAVHLEAVGTGIAMQSVVLYPEAEGKVTQVAMAAAKVVDKGTVLMRLDSSEQEVAVSRARVQIQAAEQLLDRYSRAQPGAVPATQIDTARTDLQQAKLALEQAEVMLERRQIRAPFRGTIGLTDIDIGDRVSPSTMIATFDDLSAVQVDFMVPEQFLGRIHVGDQIGLTPWVADGVKSTGEVSDLDARVDRASGTFRVRSRVPNAENRLRPGMSFHVSVDIRGRTYPTVPEASIVWGANGPQVWVVRNDVATELPLVIVQRTAGEVLVEADLKPGDLVVYEGVQRMRSGMRVTYERAKVGPGAGDRAPAARIDG